MYMGELCVSGLETEIPSHFDRISSLWQIVREEIKSVTKLHRWVSPLLSVSVMDT